MKASREILVPRADVVSDSVLARKWFHPTIPQWWEQVVTALSVPRSTPRSGVFIVVVAESMLGPFSPLSEPFA